MTRRRELMKWAGLNGLTAVAGLAAAAKLPNATLGSQQAKITKHDFGDLRMYFDGATDQVRAMTAGSLRLNPGASPHPPHDHPEEEFLLVTEGTGEITLEGKVTKVGPGSMMYCAASRLHGIVNTGKTPLLFYFFKWRA